MLNLNFSKIYQRCGLFDVKSLGQCQIALFRSCFEKWFWMILNAIKTLLACTEDAYILLVNSLNQIAYNWSVIDIITTSCGTMRYLWSGTAKSKYTASCYLWLQYHKLQFVFLPAKSSRSPLPADLADFSSRSVIGSILVIESRKITSRGSTSFAATLLVRVVTRIAPFAPCGRYDMTGLQHMPDEILIKIVRYLPIDLTGRENCSSHAFDNLSLCSGSFYHICKISSYENIALYNSSSIWSLIKMALFRSDLASLV